MKINEETKLVILGKTVFQTVTTSTCEEDDQPPVGFVVGIACGILSFLLAAIIVRTVRWSANGPYSNHRCEKMTEDVTDRCEMMTEDETLRGLVQEYKKRSN